MVDGHLPAVILPVVTYSQTFSYLPSTHVLLHAKNDAREFPTEKLFGKGINLLRVNVRQPVKLGYISSKLISSASE